MRLLFKLALLSGVLVLTVEHLLEVRELYLLGLHRLSQHRLELRVVRLSPLELDELLQLPRVLDFLVDLKQRIRSLQLRSLLLGLLLVNLPFH